MEKIYKEKYMVYSDGRIKSLRLRKVFLKGFDNGKGYLYVGVGGPKAIHRIVAECFLGDKPLGYTVNHKDGNKLNNNIENLEYITRKQNYEHALSTGLKRNLKSVLSNNEISDMIEFYFNTKYGKKYIASLVGFDKVIFRKLLKDFDFKQK